MICLFYLIAFKTPYECKQALKLIDNRLGVPIDIRDYAVDCSINYENIISVLDRFIISHFIGWSVAVLIIRDVKYTWLLSVLWELIEYLTKDIVPNFAECWWDILFIDILLCNGIGVILGHFIMKNNLGIKEYKWFENINNCIGLLKTFKNFFIVTICTCLAQLNGFLLKLFLWIPTDHSINLVRMVLLGLLLIPSMNQFYQYVNVSNVNNINRRNKNGGMEFAYLFFVIILLELCLIYKIVPQDTYEYIMDPYAQHMHPYYSLSTFIGSLIVTFVVLITC